MQLINKSVLLSAVPYLAAVDISRHHISHDNSLSLSGDSNSVAGSFLSAKAFSKAADDKKNRPITKVLNVLKQMRDNLENDRTKDEKLFKKMTCWADKNIKQKTDEIASGEDAQRSLESALEQGEATHKRLVDEIANLKEEIEEKTQSLAQATSIREKEHKEYNEESKELTENIQALKGAIVVLKRHQAGGDAEGAAKGEAAALIQKLLVKETYLTGRSSQSRTGALARRSKMSLLLTELRSHKSLQDPAPADGEEGGYWNAKAIGSENYNSASGSVFGMLQQMQDDMENDLKEANELEATRAREFSEIKASLETEISEAINSKESKAVENQKTLDKIAVDKVSLRDTLKDLAANKDYLAMVQETKKKNDAEYADRVKATAEQLKAVSEAIKILSSDELHDLVSSHFNREKAKAHVLLQTRISTVYQKDRIARAISLLSLKGMSTARLSMLALSKLDAFEKVKEAIDQMIADLNTTNKDEIAKRDVCVDQIATNDKDMATEHLVKEGHESDIEDLTGELAGIEDKLVKLNAEVHEIDVAIKVAGEDRSEQNADFQAVIDEQVATVKILNQALKVLEKVYAPTISGDENQAALFQKDAPAPDASPKFEAYKKQDNSVFGILKAVITESENLKKQAITAEQTSQEAYEKFVIESNKNRDIKGEAIVNMTEKKGEVEQSLVQSNSHRDNSVKTLADLAQTEQDLHTACDFVIKNFEITQEARANEIDALKQAKAILSGAQ